MQTFIQFLIEGISPIVYHYTSMANAFSILHKNQFRLANSLGVDKEEKQKVGAKNFYLSTTRHKLGGYHLNPNDHSVMFILDGTKLGQRYSSKATSYFNKEDRIKNREDAEAEDRIYNTKPFIPNAISYIKEAHLLYQDEAYSNKSKKYVRGVLISCKKHGIPHWVYNDERAFILQNKNKSVKINIGELSGKGQSTFNNNQRAQPQKKNEDREFAQGIIAASTELAYKKQSQIQELSPNAKLILKIIGQGKANEVKKTLGEFFTSHELRSDGGKMINNFSRVINKFGAKNISQYVDKLAQKWVHA